MTSNFIRLWKSSDSSIYFERTLKYSGMFVRAIAYTLCRFWYFVAVFRFFVHNKYMRLCGYIKKWQEMLCMNAMNIRKNALTHQVNRNDVSLYHIYHVLYCCFIFWVHFHLALLKLLPSMAAFWHLYRIKVIAKQQKITTT